MRHRRRYISLATCLSFALGGIALAQEQADPHLTITPRSGPEMARISAVLALPTDFTAPEPFETLPAGKATFNGAISEGAFGTPSAQMSDTRQLDFAVGQSIFEKLWVSSPSSTLSSDGLGPLYNARACVSCHINEGRGHPPAQSGPASLPMVLRLSQPGTPDSPRQGVRPTAHYGDQLQDKSVAGLAAEGRVQITYTDHPVTMGDGTVITLRRPGAQAVDLAYGPLPADTLTSLRAPQQMIGLGLLEAIPADDILALADPDDRDGDGISGRANRVWSNAFDQPMIGRFGHKAGAATLVDQVTDAFSNDIGLSTPLLPAHAGDCTAAQPACLNAPHGESGSPDGYEVSAQVLDLITLYTRNLAVPARRNVDDPTVLRGKGLFHAAGCPACHQPKFVTHRLPDQPEQSFQLIWPFTDLLLHDMGPGLADNRPEWAATVQEWRTAPLWGIGLTKTVSGEASFLHDGRARSILEAILWHGGEATAAQTAVRMMPAPDREALIAYVESL